MTSCYIYANELMTSEHMILLFLATQYGIHVGNCNGHPIVIFHYICSIQLNLGK